MLKKNKDYVEFTLQYTSVDWERRSKDCPEVCFKGYSDFSFPGVPIMDVVCNEFDHKVVVVSKRDFEKLQTENKELKQKMHGFDPTPEFKELLKNLYSIEDVEKLEWFLNRVCGGLGSATGWRSIATFWKNRYNDLFKLIGFSSTEEIQDYLTNEAECDTLQEAISKLKDQVKYTCDEWYSANSSNNSWKAAAECNSPKELIEKLNLLRDDISGRSTVIESYKRDIEKWQKATGCDTPDKAKERIKALNERIDESEADYNHLLCTTGFESEGEIEDALDKCDHSTLRKALVDYEFDYEALLKFTGYKSEHDIRVMLNDEKYQYKTMRELINSLERKVKFTDSNWQKATGCDTPGMAEEKIKYYKSRLGTAVQAASCAAKHLDNITF